MINQKLFVSVIIFILSFVLVVLVVLDFYYFANRQESELKHYNPRSKQVTLKMAGLRYSISQLAK